jgi:hypothetical protein
MEEFQTERIKELVAAKIKEIKGVTPYAEIAGKCNTSPAKISNAANNKIDCRLSTFIEIATGMRIHPKELFDIMFDFDDYYANLDGALGNEQKQKELP